MNFNAMKPYDLGESKSKEALPHLIVYLHNGSDNDKRLAASAIIKLSDSGINCYSALPFLLKNIHNPKPQVRQYTLKALKGFIIPEDYYGEILELVNTDEKEYNRHLASEILSGFSADLIPMHSNSTTDKEEVSLDLDNEIITTDDEVSEKGYVYFIKEDYAGRIKIGKTRDINQRMDTFNVKLPFNVELIHVIESANYHYTEKLFHVLFDSKRVNGEWFNLNENDISWVKSGNYTKRIMGSILNESNAQKSKSKQINITDKQTSFLTALLENSRLMLTKPVSQLSATEAASLIGYLYKGEQLPRELLGMIQSKQYFQIN